MLYTGYARICLLYVYVHLSYKCGRSVAVIFTQTKRQVEVLIGCDKLYTYVKVY